MKTDKKQQELVLLTTTTFSKREWCHQGIASNRKQTHAEQLEEACWNGLLGEMLPELLETATTGRQLFLWHIRPEVSFLKIELSEVPPRLDDAFSIDALFFLPTLVYN